MQRRTARRPASDEEELDNDAITISTKAPNSGSKFRSSIFSEKPSPSVNATSFESLKNAFMDEPVENLAYVDASATELIGNGIIQSMQGVSDSTCSDDDDDAGVREWENKLVQKGQIFVKQRLHEHRASDAMTPGYSNAAELELFDFSALSIEDVDSSLSTIEAASLSIAHHIQQKQEETLSLLNDKKMLLQQHFNQKDILVQNVAYYTELFAQFSRYAACLSSSVVHLNLLEDHFLTWSKMPKNDASGNEGSMSNEIATSRNQLNNILTTELFSEILLSLNSWSSSFPDAFSASFELFVELFLFFARRDFFEVVTIDSFSNIESIRPVNSFWYKGLQDFGTSSIPIIGQRCRALINTLLDRSFVRLFLAAGVDLSLLQEWVERNSEI